MFEKIALMKIESGTKSDIKIKWRKPERCFRR